MKKVILSLVVVLLLGVVACQKGYYGTPINRIVTGGVSSDEAADMVANSLSVSSNGVVNIAGDVTNEATSFAKAHLGCGTLRSDTISRQSAAGSATTYSYNLNYNFIVVCGTDNKPDSLSSSLIYSGSFNGPNLSTNNSGSSIFGVSGLDSASANFVINGEYKSSGSFSSKIDTANHGSNNIDVALKALTLKKPSRSIASGSATIAINGMVPKRGSFSYAGNLVFNGDGTATLTLNGTVYKINLNTGYRQHM
jgi:uncharacterized Zn-binding protein involved in type VI secretion